jgi:protein-arginine kinase activator protein McsA
MQCEVCQDRQHIRCYGYLDTDTLLDTHICYKCLLATEPNLYKEMKELCLTRQLAWVVAMEGYPLKELDLAQRIGEQQQLNNHFVEMLIILQGAWLKMS